MSLDDLTRLAALASVAARVEGDALALLTDPGALPGIGELVAWAWTIDPSGRSTLLVDHHHFGKWLPPGGRVHPGEHPRDAVLRELHEETGLSARFLHEHPALVDAVHTEAPDGSPVVTFGIAFLLEASPTDVLIAEPGQRVAWWPIDAPPEPRAAHHWRRLTQHLGYPQPS